MDARTPHTHTQTESTCAQFWSKEYAPHSKCANHMCDLQMCRQWKECKQCALLLFALLSVVSLNCDHWDLCVVHVWISFVYVALLLSLLLSCAVCYFCCSCCCSRCFWCTRWLVLVCWSLMTGPKKHTHTWIQISFFCHCDCCWLE